MRVGMIGLGKLGLPVAASIAWKGHDVAGYDVNPDALSATPVEEGLREVTLDIAKQRIRAMDHDELVEWAELIFVAVQTPHEPEYEGVTRIPESRVDFDYRHLNAALYRLKNCGKPVAIISTVLPGTLSDEWVYNPSFIAMGTTMRDFLHPEFVLLGGRNAQPFARFYRTLTDAPIYRTGVREAEAVKVFYNTFIGLKVAFANTVMEACHKLDADADQVTDALKLANRRLISTAYLSGGMGDGGGCHPRDNIALSHLARKLDMSFDLFDAVMKCRESQADWLVDLMEEHDLPKAILGASFKAESAIVTGSPAILCKNILEERGYAVTLADARVWPNAPAIRLPHVFLIGAKHPEHVAYPFPRGSVVIDPWRYIPPREGVTVIGVGAVSDDRPSGEGDAVSARAA